MNSLVLRSAVPRSLGSPEPPSRHQLLRLLQRCLGAAVKFVAGSSPSLGVATRAGTVLDPI